MLSSGWLASYVGQSEVPALITSIFFLDKETPILPFSRIETVIKKKKMTNKKINKCNLILF